MEGLQLSTRGFQGKQKFVFQIIGIHCRVSRHKFSREMLGENYFRLCFFDGQIIDGFGTCHNFTLDSSSTANTGGLF